MPLVPEHSWRQTEQRVVVTVSLHRHPCNTVDLVITSRYVKASFPPYCLEVFLHEPVAADRAITRPHQDSLQLLLDKSEAGEWPALTRPLGKEAAAAARQEALEELRQMLEQRTRDNQAERTAGERQGISRQLQLDDAERAEQLRIQERMRFQFFSEPASEEGCSSLAPNGTGSECDPFPPTPAAEEEDEDITDRDPFSRPTRSPPLTRRSGSLTSSAADSSDTAPLTSSKEDLRPLNVDWSPSSRRRLSTESSSGGSPEKGFMMAGLVGGEGGKAVRRRVSEDREYDGDGEDHYSSTENVMAMLSVGDAAAGGRRRLLTRKSGGGGDRGRAEDEEEAALGIAEVAAAESRVPSSEDVGGPATRAASKKARPSGKGRHYGHAVRAPRSITVCYTSRPNHLPARESRDGAPPAGGDQVAGMPDTAVQDLLEKAKTLYESGAYSESASCYGSVLDVRPDSVQALSNRAAAHLANKAPHLAVRDASKALSLCASGSDKSRLLCLLRRGAAYVSLGQLQRALADYEAALALQPNNSAVKTDCANIRSRLETSETSSLVETEEESEHSPSMPEIT